MRNNRFRNRGLAILALIAVSAAGATSSLAADDPNFIVILADDYGNDAFALLNPTTGEGTNAPVPSLHAIAEEGVRFDNAWAMPVCSTTRGARTYGLLPSTTGMGGVIGQFTPRLGAEGPFHNVEFPPTMVNPNDPNLIQKIMRDGGYRTLKLGKWHETRDTNPPTAQTDSGAGLPEIAEDVCNSGFDEFYGFAAGTIANHGGTGGGTYPLLKAKTDISGDCDVSDPDPTLKTEVIETDEFTASFLVSRAIEFANSNPSNKPYYIALDFAAPHWVFNVNFPEGPLSDGYQVAPGPNELAPTVNPPDFPPVDWRTLNEDDYASVIDDVVAAFGEYPTAGTRSLVCSPPERTACSRAAFKSKVAYMDLQIGRLLEHVDLDNTYVIFMGDNGTQAGPPLINVVEEPNDSTRSKGTLYRNGVEVPFIIAGPNIKNPGRVSDSLINSTDILATVLDLAGLPRDQVDAQQSKSAKPVLNGGKGTRQFNVAEAFTALPTVGALAEANGIPRGPGGNDGRVVGDGRFRLIAKPRLVQGEFVCKATFVPSGDDLLDAECFNPATGIYEKEHDLEFYDTEEDPFELTSLVIDDMTKKQSVGFNQLCSDMNKVSRKAIYHQNGVVCDKKGSDLVQIVR